VAFLLRKIHLTRSSDGNMGIENALACIIREDTAEGVLGDMRSPKALLAA
jgi:hypothetical protein